MNAKLKGFDEALIDGDAGAELAVSGGRSKHSYATAGVKWGGHIGGLVPEVNLGYRYRFGDRRSQFTASGIGGEVASFDIVSASQKRGTLLGGVSLGGKVGPVNLRIGYEGEFNSDVTSHTGSFKLVLPLGGSAAAPPPPPVQVAPPPPPAPPEAAPAPVEAASPPPPPPPPVERGERGQ